MRRLWRASGRNRQQLLHTSDRGIGRSGPPIRHQCRLTRDTFDESNGGRSGEECNREKLDHAGHYFGQAHGLSERCCFGERERISHQGLDGKRKAVSLC